MNRINNQIDELSFSAEEFIRRLCSFAVIQVFIFVIIIVSVYHTVNADVFKIPTGDVNSFIDAINSSNDNHEDDTIFLESGIYTLTQAFNNSSFALPSITSRITINGDSPTIIERNVNAPQFSIFNVTAQGDLILNGLTISGGSCTFNFGGAINNEGALIITDSIISGNFCGVGGGISNGGTLTIENCTISGNDASSDAGGGINNGGTLTIINSLVADNIAAEGGGIINLPWATLHIFNSTFTGNTNTAIDTFGPLTITNSTIFDNPDAGISNNAGNNLVELQNTILAGNRPDCRGEVTSLGNNIIADTSGCTTALLPNDLKGNPGLDKFTDDGTPGNGHFPLLARSRAINAGNNGLCLNNVILAADQIGNPRYGICDIGSIEFLPIFKNQGQCISKLIKQNCSHINKKDRSACNKIQQHFCKSLFKRFD